MKNSIFAASLLLLVLGAAPVNAQPAPADPTPAAATPQAPGALPDSGKGLVAQESKTPKAPAKTEPPTAQAPGQKSGEEGAAAQGQAGEGGFHLNVGMALGLLNTPGEADLTGETPTFAVFTTLGFSRWLTLRIEYAQATAAFQDYDLATTGLNLLYTAGLPLGGPFTGYGVLGLAMMSSAATFAGGGEPLESSGTGTVFGAGLDYAWGRWLLGGQFIVVSRTGDFDGLKISDGSNQFRISAAFGAL